MHVVPQRHRSQRDHSELSRVEALSTAVVMRCSQFCSLLNSGYWTREPWLWSGQDYAKAMPSKQSEKNQMLKVSWFTESKSCSEVVIGTAQ